MYLGMTEDDFQSVYDGTPRIVGRRIGLAVDGLLLGDLLNSIKEIDIATYELMEQFRGVYKQWWDLSNSLPQDRHSRDFLEAMELLQKLIFKRDEIRKALISYLNFKYGNSSE